MLPTALSLAFFSIIGCYLFIFPGWFDGAELSLAIQTLGVSHPTGHSVYLMFGKLFTFLPIGSIAWRTSLASLVGFALCVRLTTEIFRHFSPQQPKTELYAVLFLVVVLYLNPLLGLQASRTEIYSLASAQVLGIFLLCLKSQQRTDVRLYIAASFLFGLSMATHPLIGACALPCFMPTNKSEAKTLPLAAAFCILGYMSCLYLPLRSAASPMLNWGEPTNLSRLLRVLFALDYQSFYLPSLSVLEGGRWLTKLLGATFFTLSFIGFFSLRGGNSTKSITVYGSVLLLNFGGAIFTGMYRQNPDSYGYLMPFLFLASPLFIMGLRFTTDLVVSRPLKMAFPVVIALSSIASNIAPAFTAWQSHGGPTEMTSSRTLFTLFPSSVAYVESDHWLFPFWYRQVVERQRPDVVVVALGLSNTTWYRNQITGRNKGFFPNVEYFEAAALRQRTFLENFSTNMVLFDDFRAQCHRASSLDRLFIHEGLGSQMALGIFQRHLQKLRYTQALNFAESYLDISPSRRHTKDCASVDSVNLAFELRHRSVKTFLPTEKHLRNEYSMLKMGCGETLSPEELLLLRGDFLEEIQ